MSAWGNGTDLPMFFVYDPAFGRKPSIIILSQAK